MPYYIHSSARHVRLFPECFGSVELSCIERFTYLLVRLCPHLLGDTKNGIAESQAMAYQIAKVLGSDGTNLLFHQQQMKVANIPNDQAILIELYNE